MPNRMWQNPVTPVGVRSDRVFGGDLQRGKRKRARPISRKHHMHLVLRSRLAIGRRSFLHPKNRDPIERILQLHAKGFGVKLRSIENQGRTLHLVLKASHRRGLAAFLRTVTGLIARKIMGTERGRPLAESFWDGRPFSRVVRLGGELVALLRRLGEGQVPPLGFIYRGRVITDLSTG
jgi:hypothetical protein